MRVEFPFHKSPFRISRHLPVTEWFVGCARGLETDRVGSTTRELKLPGKDGSIDSEEEYYAGH